MEQKLLIPADDFTIEIFEYAIKRYSGFGKDLYKLIKQEIPIVFEKLVFYKRISIQQEDSYAIYTDKEKSFAIQLDPLCEVIVLWNENIHTEIGTWSEDVYEEAIGFIESEFLRGGNK
jgi:hypothetical protein